jgi:hypothetical protein
LTGQLHWLAQRPRQIAAQRLEPTIARPFDRFQQRLPAERAKAVLDAVIHHEPFVARSFEDRCVAA